MKKKYLSPELEYTERRSTARICNDEENGDILINVSGVDNNGGEYMD